MPTITSFPVYDCGKLTPICTLSARVSEMAKSKNGSLFSGTSKYSIPGIGLAFKNKFSGNSMVAIFPIIVALNPPNRFISDLLNDAFILAKREMEYCPFESVIGNLFWMLSESTPLLFLSSFWITCFTPMV